ncbi:MAG: T9SS type A sorting domain-containing protein [Ignavibacteriae bacterium]|nr:T9SS type A sorting domain-containing protein [Ignavibacteriota bacterium]
MNNKSLKYWFSILLLVINTCVAYSQTSIDQKLSIVSNSGIVGGDFIIEYSVKGTNLTVANTLGSLNADIIFDTSAIKFSYQTEWNTSISQVTGYDRSVSCNDEEGVSRSLRIMVQGLNVNSGNDNSESGYNIESGYSSIVRIIFTIADISKSATITFKSVTNQIGLFENPGNNPNSFVINDQYLSAPLNIEDQPLPVTLAYFNSAVKVNDVTLNWSTSSEYNNAGFCVERKSDENSNWLSIGYVKGQGNSNTQVKYSYEDKKLATGKYIYRLKQTDNNGNFKYYGLNGTVEVGSPLKFNLSQNYPNPFNPVTKINYELPKDSKVNITVFDVTGREVSKLVNQEQKAGYYTVSMDAKNLASGTYFYRLIAKSGNNDHVITKKMSIIK